MAGWVGQVAGCCGGVFFSSATMAVEIGSDVRDFLDILVSDVGGGDGGI